ncbi:MAG: purine-nucleoside phosphorylase [Sulfurovum sp.]|nr:MAG: purine-nucleoside phosphorylase [Sulfurovum sp.]
MFICAGESEQFDFALPVGIGMIDVTINLTKLCLTKMPDSLIFVGTAGSYGEKKIFDIVKSKTATHIENSFFISNAYTPIENKISMLKNVSRETIVNSSDYITTQKSLGKAYRSKNIHLENMEYYAVLKVAKYFGIPAKGIFIVTNYCDASAHEDFLKNHKEAMKRLTKYIQESKIDEN